MSITQTDARWAVKGDELEWHNGTDVMSATFVSYEEGSDYAVVHVRGYAQETEVRLTELVIPLSDED